MAAGNRRTERNWRAYLLSGVAALCISTGLPQTGLAQDVVADPLAPTVSDDAKLLLTAQQLVYDRDNQKIVAVGGVQIDYGGNKLVAKRVEYDQKSGRMVAIGEIEFIEPNGNRVYADRLDVTDDFANGFVSALRLETTDNTRLVANKGRRVNGDVMILDKGVYTACEPCK